MSIPAPDDGGGSPCPSRVVVLAAKPEPSSASCSPGMRRRVSKGEGSPPAGLSGSEWLRLLYTSPNIAVQRGAAAADADYRVARRSGARATTLRPVVSEVQTFRGARAHSWHRSYGVDEGPEPRKPRRAVARPSAEPCASNAPVRSASTSGTTARATDSARPTRYAPAASTRPRPRSPLVRFSPGGGGGDRSAPVTHASLPPFPRSRCSWTATSSTR